MNIGAKIKHFRAVYGLSQTELGARLGVKKDAVSKWECGRVTAIPTQKLMKMAEMFNIPLSELIDDNEVVGRQNPLAMREAALAFLRELNMYIAPPYDEANNAVCDLINKPVHTEDWMGYNPMLGEEYRISLSRIEESTEVLASVARVLFGPEELETYHYIIRNLSRTPHDAQRMIRAQMQIVLGE